MTDGIGIRITITVITALQAMVAALLGFGEIIPQNWKIILVVASAGLAVIANQVPSWQQAPAASRALKKAGAE